MIHDPDRPKALTPQLRNRLIWMIIFIGAGLFWYSLLRANIFWNGNQQQSYVPVSINAVRTADYSPFTSGPVGQVDLGIIIDVIQEMDPDGNSQESFATLRSGLQTPITTATPTPGAVPVGTATSILTLTPATGVPTVTLPTTPGPTLPGPTNPIPTLPLPTISIPTISIPSLPLPTITISAIPSLPALPWLPVLRNRPRT